MPKRSREPEISEHTQDEAEDAEVARQADQEKAQKKIATEANRAAASEVNAAVQGQARVASAAKGVVRDVVTNAASEAGDTTDPATIGTRCKNAAASTFDPDGTPDPDLARSASTDSDGKKKSAELFKEFHDKISDKITNYKLDLGGETGPGTFGDIFKNIFKAKKTQLKLEPKLRNKLGNQKYEEGVQKPLDTLNRLHKNGHEKWTSKDMQDYNDASNKIDDTLKDLDKEWLTEQKEKDAEDGKKSGKKSKLSDLVKILGILSVLGASITALVLLIIYTNDHSGCLKIHAGSDTSFVQNFKVYCKSGLTGSDNEAGAQVTFLPSQCLCQAADNTKKTASAKTGCNCGEDASSCSENTAADFSDQIGPCDPVNGGLSGNPTSFTYYSYTVMSPLDGALNILSKGVNLADSLWTKILKFIIGLAIVIGSLAGVYIIYLIIKHFLNKSKTVKSETVKFGTKGQYRLKIDSAIPVSRIKQYKFGKYRNY